MESKYMIAPFAKVNETEDGGREVWGFATLERVDKAGEIADFESTVKAFEKWSGEVSERTGGKSLGNVRLMHQKIPAGKTIHWEPAEKTVKNDKGEDEVIKGIYVGAYVPPTKPEIIKDVDEGILSGFSIGGGYAKRWYDSVSKAFRYTPTISEYSLVDNPCVEGADIVNVIAKADGPWNKNYSNYEKGDNILENENQELNKRAKIAGSYEELFSRIDNALNDKFKGIRNWWDGYRAATKPTSVIIYDYEKGKYYEVSYTDVDGVITIGDDAAEVQEVTNYVPVEAQKAVEAELQKRAQSIENNKDTEQKEVEKSMDEENLIKAAESVGITLEQFKTLIKAVIPQDDDGAVKTTVDTTNLNPPNGNQADIEGGQSSVEEAERATYKTTLDEMKKTIDSLIEESNNLEKVNVAVSKDRMNHLKHAKNHIDAAMGGTSYGPDEHLVIEGNGGQGNTGEEAPVVAEKVIIGELQKGIDEVENKLSKAINDSLQEKFSKIEAMFKSVPNSENFEELQKSLKNLERLENLEKLVKEIHETPQSNNLVFNGGSPDMQKMLGQGGHFNMQNYEEEVLKKFVTGIQDPIIKDKAGQELAMRQYKNSLNQGGVK